MFTFQRYLIHDLLKNSTITDSGITYNLYGKVYCLYLFTKCYLLAELEHYFKQWCPCLALVYVSRGYNSRKT